MGRVLASSFLLLFPKARVPRLRSIVGLALASALPGLSVPAQAQTTEAPFACDGTFLLAQGANTTLYSIDLTTIKYIIYK